MIKCKFKQTGESVFKIHIKQDDTLQIILHRNTCGHIYLVNSYDWKINEGKKERREKGGAND